MYNWVESELIRHYIASIEIVFAHTEKFLSVAHYNNMSDNIGVSCQTVDNKGVSCQTVEDKEGLQ